MGKRKAGPSPPLPPMDREATGNVLKKHRYVRLEGMVRARNEVPVAGWMFGPMSDKEDVISWILDREELIWPSLVVR